MSDKPKMKYCWHHQQYHPVEAFAENKNKPDGLQTECRAAQSERRGQIGKRVATVGAWVAVAMFFHWLISSVFGVFLPFGIFGGGGAPDPVDPSDLDMMGNAGPEVLNAGWTESNQMVEPATAPTLEPTIDAGVVEQDVFWAGVSIDDDGSLVADGGGLYDGMEVDHDEHAIKTIV